MNLEERTEYLKKRHTKQLLEYLRAARACGGSYSPFDSSYGPHFSIEEIKKELSFRPHIPNKREAKVIRQQKAKKGR